MSESTIKVGQKFGLLTIIDYRERTEKRQSFLCKCDCGTIKTLGRTELLGSKGRRPTKSCGCALRSQGGKMVKNQRLYGIWHGMISRCHNPKTHNYSRYGALGIRVVDEWREDFIAFLDWSMANGYQDDLTIDRIDSGGNYSPDNCRWADYYTQIHNRKPFKSSKTGKAGVTPNPKGGYRVAIKRNNKLLHLGIIDDLDDAIELRVRAEQYFESHQTFEGFEI